ncbi:hypothetical protein [Microbacterium sp. 3J1]|uniref:hypothetical protein n=1 Tax=Microbacterium sp. 3J1 TaxID=861269 RepID=UPI001146FBC8|nr:hypothetical protein [Microbacterium sp. 3J1]
MPDIVDPAAPLALAVAGHGGKDRPVRGQLYYEGIMQMITYAGDEYLTGDDIADALLAYSRALGDNERAEIVEIPIREDDGTEASAKFLIGPASQIVIRSVSEQGSELEDPELVARLRQATRNVEAPAALPLEAPANVESDLD